MVFYALFHTKSMLRGLVEKVLRAQMRSHIDSEENRKVLIPSYNAGCKRITPSDTYLEGKL